MLLTSALKFPLRQCDCGLLGDCASAQVKRQSSCVGGTHTTSNGDVFSVSCGIDYPGDDMSQVASVSIANCLEACSNSHPLCIAIAFEASLAHGTKNCYLKSSVGAAVTQTYSMDGAYSAPTPESNSCVSEVSPYTSRNGLQFSLSCGLDYDGGDLSANHSSSLDACIEQCAAYGSGCVGVAYEASLVHGFANCYLKSQVSTPTQQAFVVHGAKLIGTSTTSSTLSTSSSTSSVSVTSSISTSSSAQVSLEATPSTSPTSTATSTNTKGLKIGLGVGISVGVLLFALLAIFLFRYFRDSHARKNLPVPRPQDQELDAAEKSGSAVESRTTGRGELEGRHNQIFELPLNTGR
ncbi:hypothetical protein BDZ45DRAFT_248959 [Acephala macrosclerotiorum]|nr:hypothetical protein BDZ45DRAFT_248959 [Acephala macrosclerotiorum]